LSVDGETVEVLGRLGVHVYRGDTSSRWSLPAPLDKPVYGARVALDDHFHSAVGEVAGPACYPERLRLLGARTAVPDALHLAADQQVPADHGANLPGCEPSAPGKEQARRDQQGRAVRLHGAGGHQEFALAVTKSGVDLQRLWIERSL
jgi:hypothetical protein